jgi:hypothetical protein
MWWNALRYSTLRSLPSNRLPFNPDIHAQTKRLIDPIRLQTPSETLFFNFADADVLSSLCKTYETVDCKSPVAESRI